MLTMPNPRFSYYESSNYDEIQANILHHTNAVVRDLGVYAIRAKLDLLEEMQIFSY